MGSPLPSPRPRMAQHQLARQGEAIQLVEGPPMQGRPRREIGQRHVVPVSWLVFVTSKAPKGRLFFFSSFFIQKGDRLLLGEEQPSCSPSPPFLVQGDKSNAKGRVLGFVPNESAGLRVQACLRKIDFRANSYDTKARYHAKWGLPQQSCGLVASCNPFSLFVCRLGAT